MTWSRFAASLVAALLGLVLAAAPVSAEPPFGGVVLSTTYPSVAADRGKSLSFAIEVTNRTQDFQEVTLEIAAAPEGWQPELKDRGYAIRSVMLGPSKSQTLDFQARPPDGVKAQEYAFVIRALAASGRLVSELRLVVSLQDRVSVGLRLSTQFPNLRGQAGNTFSFKFDLQNDAGIDREVSLSANVPRGWEIVFKPAFESKQVSQFRMKAGTTQGVDVEITPPQRIEAGEYKVVVTASAEGDRAEVPLNVAIVGSNRISLSTPSGQLNTKATIDSESKLSLVVKNTGSAPLRNVTLSSSKPEGWQVTFTPDRIDELPAGQELSVTAAIKPSPRALAGDYLLTLSAFAQQTSDNKDIRVTVETPTAWGWFAVFAIVAVFGGLGWLFWKFSRR